MQFYLPVVASIVWGEKKKAFDYSINFRLGSALRLFSLPIFVFRFGWTLRAVFASFWSTGAMSCLETHKHRFSLISLSTRPDGLKPLSYWFPCLATLTFTAVCAPFWSTGALSCSETHISYLISPPTRPDGLKLWSYQSLPSLLPTSSSTFTGVSGTHPNSNGVSWFSEASYCVETPGALMSYFCGFKFLFLEKMNFFLLFLICG